MIGSPDFPANTSGGWDSGRSPSIASGGTPGASDRSPVPRLALSPDEAAHALGVSRDFFDEHIKCELRIVRRGRRRLIPVEELRRWLARESALPLERER